MPKVTLTFKGQTQVHELRRGLGLQALAAKAETPLEFSCREADCAICIVQVLEGAENLSPTTPREKDFLQAMAAEPNERLACQCRVLGDVTLRVEDY
jgi:ferredoxin